MWYSAFSVFHNFNHITSDKADPNVPLSTPSSCGVKHCADGQMDRYLTLNNLFQSFYFQIHACVLTERTPWHYCDIVSFHGPLYLFSGLWWCLFDVTRCIVQWSGPWDAPFGSRRRGKINKHLPADICRTVDTPLRCRPGALFVTFSTKWTASIAPNN